jgi:hypothetical protein
MGEKQQNQDNSNDIQLNIRPDICYFGLANLRGKTKPFGLLEDDRRKHLYILGKTGMGKSTLLQNMILQDIYNGFGVCFLDPHGDSAEYILDRIPEYRHQDIVYFNPGDTDHPFGFNMLEAKRGEEPHLIVSGMMAVFNHIWAGMWSARMEYILTNTLLALLETPGSTLLGVVRMLTDNDYRDKIVRNVQDPMVKNFWKKEFAGFNDRYRQEAIAPVLNKIGQFFSTDLTRNILGQVKSTIDFRDIMDKKKILIVNLSKGKLGEDNSALLGSLINTKLQVAAMSRVDIPESERNDFYLYVDEFQNFTTDVFATILSEARKYRLNLTLAHQYIAQLTESGSEKIKNAVFGNVGSIITFRVGSDDTEILEKEFRPVFALEDLIGLNKYQITVKMSIRGKSSNPFLASTLPPIFDEYGGQSAIAMNSSRSKYGRHKEIVKTQINNWLNDRISEEDLLQGKAEPDHYNEPQTPLSKSQKKKKKKKNSYLPTLTENQNSYGAGQVEAKTSEIQNSPNGQNNLQSSPHEDGGFHQTNQNIIYENNPSTGSVVQGNFALSGQNTGRIQLPSRPQSRATLRLPPTQKPIKNPLLVQKLNALKQNFPGQNRIPAEPDYSNASIQNLVNEPQNKQFTGIHGPLPTPTSRPIQTEENQKQQAFASIPNPFDYNIKLNHIPGKINQPKIKNDNDESDNFFGLPDN